MYASVQLHPRILPFVEAFLASYLSFPSQNLNVFESGSEPAATLLT